MKWLFLILGMPHSHTSSDASCPTWELISIAFKLLPWNRSLNKLNSVFANARIKSEIVIVLLLNLEQLRVRNLFGIGISSSVREFAIPFCREPPGTQNIRNRSNVSEYATLGRFQRVIRQRVTERCGEIGFDK